MAMHAFTLTEAAALLDLPERHVRKEVEHGLFSARLSLQALVYLETLHELGFELGVEDRRRLFEIVTREMRAQQSLPELVAFSRIVMLRLGPVVREVEKKVERFFHWKDKLVIDPRILGGEPVFPGSRLAVRHVGNLLDRGVSPGTVQEDYPYLSDEDLQFSLVFARAYPRVGRPRDIGSPSAR